MESSVGRIGILVLLVLFIVIGCSREKPTVYDGSFGLRLYVTYEGKPAVGLAVFLEPVDFVAKICSDTTDSSGLVEFDDLLFSQYRAYVSTEMYLPSDVHPGELDTISVIGNIVIYPTSNFVVDSIGLISSGAEPGLKINELYTVGPPNDFFYYFDQFIELYNSSTDTVYLDGMIVCRMGDEGIRDVTYIFQFPGEPLVGREYPVPPGTFVVLAVDAIDHREIVPQSIDLSNADWEFKNSRDFGDVDNPDVPNIDNILEGHTRDFSMNLVSEVVLIADGSDAVYIDGIDPETVIDCVEYSSNPNHIKEIEKFLDMGFCGVGMQRYSSQSRERIKAGFDTNNSTVDFEVIPFPTPGYQHE
ncbi:MAG: hypothetical protein DRP88_00285 [Candidatus Neomarinimicrobiota bacterium]|nr:MAG: hypothetical protein DRP88_00285 [Candidatus Neomarinimicrobiota bacterium]